MTATTESARQIPILVTLLNPVVRRALALGVPMGPNVLLTVRGRTSGRDYTFPVATLEVDGREFVFSPFGEVQWVRNLRVAGEATIRRGRRTRRVAAVELWPEAAAPMLEAGLRPVLSTPLFGSMIAGWYGIDQGSMGPDYLASARAHPAFELREIG